MIVGNIGRSFSNEMEYVPCNLCGSTNNTLLYNIKDWAYETEGSFTLVQCECGLVYLSLRPIMQVMSKYYPQNYIPYYQASPPTGRLRQTLYYWKWRARCLQVLKVCNKGRILDIGCSSGLFLQALVRYGDWETHGIEVNTKMANMARESGIKVIEGEVADAKYLANYFDVVTLWDVLEHLHNPRATLNEISRILKPGGTLFISVPNLNSLDAKIFKKYWIGFDTPRHLYIYNADSLIRYLDLTGFNVEQVYSFYGRYTVFALSLNSWLKQFTNNARLRRWLEKLLFFPLWRQLTLPYFWIIDRLGLGSIITVRAKRRSEIK